MKRSLLITFAIISLLAVFVLAVQAAPKKEKKLDPSSIYGRVQFVKSFPDYKVKAVTSFPDLKVKTVKSLPNSGEWQIVESFPDYKIQLVQSFPDFTVEFADGARSGKIGGDVDCSCSMPSRKSLRAELEAKAATGDAAALAQFVQQA